MFSDVLTIGPRLWAWLSGPATSGVAPGQRAAFVEALEQRRLMSVTANLSVENPQVMEGNYAHFSLNADTDHDWTQPTLTVTMYFGDGTNEQFTMQPGQQQEIYHAYQEAENYSMNVEAFVHDDGAFTYGIGPDDDTPYTRVGVYDAPLVQKDVAQGFFDESDESVPTDDSGTYPDDTANASPTTVAEFWDGPVGQTNLFPNAQDFTAQINWGDGATGPGTVQWNSTDGSFYVTGFHDYHGPNPATSMGGDGHWDVNTTITDDDGAVITCYGRVTVHSRNWINFTAAAPQNPPVIGPISVGPTAPLMGGVLNFNFYVAEYAGRTDAQIHMGSSTDVRQIFKNCIGGFVLTSLTGTGIGPHSDDPPYMLPPDHYDYFKGSVSMSNVWPGDRLALFAYDPSTPGSGTDNINFY